MGQNKINLSSVLTEFQHQEQKKEPKKIGCKFLIVCEGEKTEPNYFRAFKGMHNGSYIVDMDFGGGGISTIGVVNEAIRLRGNNQYDSVWAVFDKDDFKDNDFNNAINKAKEKGINVAWSNDAFELWYLFHFHNRITAMGRKDYEKAISCAVNAQKKKKGYVYAKNALNNYAIMNEFGNQAQAIRWAEAQHKTFDDQKYATHNPCTTVYHLVRQLIGEDKDLIDAVMNKINEPNRV